MRMLKPAAVLIAMLFAGFAAAPANASATLQMNLAQLVDNSERIFVGTVVQVTESRKAIGGGEIPAVTYRLKVNDTFKGAYEEIKGERFTDVTMLGSLKNLASGKHPIADFPMLKVGTEYLLMVAPAGPIGLTSTMGLAQGCFHVQGTDADKVVLNGVNNTGLFSNMNVGIEDGQPVSYGVLSSMITDLVGGAE
ncbi:MAG: hypothetical protein AAGF46_07405 [Pseudomonadota bacterium]